MSVYTSVDEIALRDFLARYDTGTLVAYTGIEAGIENTNYFVDTTAGHFVLTIFEWMPATELPFFLELMRHVADGGLPGARPLADRDGVLAGELLGKPAALVTRLPGTNLLRPSPGPCRQVGAALGRWHRTVQSFPRTHPDGRGRPWREAAAARVGPGLSTGDRVLLTRTIEALDDWPAPGLPGGVIHADLFRDNVLFDGAALSGLLDFYYACSGPFVYDLAVAFADWCFVPTGCLEPENAQAFVAGYRAVRALDATECAAWPTALLAAGLRFWLSRLVDSRFPKPGALTFLKDPAEFRGLLLALTGDPVRFAQVLEA
jgi:homoserine kinase type II